MKAEAEGTEDKGMDVINGQVRHLITVAGGMLVSHGVIKESEIEVLASLVVIAVGLGWSVYAKLSKG
jgi:hypothetical protein